MPDLNSGDSPPLPFARRDQIPAYTHIKFPSSNSIFSLDLTHTTRSPTQTLSLVPATLGSFRFWDFNRGSLKLTICPAKVEEDEEEGSTGWKTTRTLRERLKELLYSSPGCRFPKALWRIILISIRLSVGILLFALPISSIRELYLLDFSLACILAYEHALMMHIACVWMCLSKNLFSVFWT